MDRREISGSVKNIFLHEFPQKKRKSCCIPTRYADKFLLPYYSANTLIRDRREDMMSMPTGKQNYIIYLLSLISISVSAFLYGEIGLKQTACNLQCSKLYIDYCTIFDIIQCIRCMGTLNIGFPKPYLVQSQKLRSLALRQPHRWCMVLINLHTCKKGPFMLV